MRNFDCLSEREVLALTISLEEEDEPVYADSPASYQRIDWRCVMSSSRLLKSAP
jgi:hypothetical protein